MCALRRVSLPFWHVLFSRGLPERERERDEQLEYLRMENVDKRTGLAQRASLNASRDQIFSHEETSLRSRWFEAPSSVVSVARPPSSKAWCDRRAR